ncbi:MAG: single-stranded DNA-binding protein [Firmicutes bacterium]|uniref:Single-stranded DNA-binding protein n=1 Tax=Candidatus Gallilactobacillus intestinavium TaxID=2840838 RepID=A0A9D9E5L5_9LACO|nr:single-stranded DNA-binding protein [Candidatus Gallilactobacillus intestinavium]
MINRVVLVGRLTKDPEVRYIQSGTAVVSFTLAVNRQYTNQQGQREADFINCVIWRKPAENFANFTKKGSLVGIDGRLQTRNYENQQGQRVYVTEVIVDNFALLESKSQTEQRNDKGMENNNPFSDQPNQNVDPFSEESTDSIDISDDDLPF